MTSQTFDSYTYNVRALDYFIFCTGLKDSSSGFDNESLLSTNRIPTEHRKDYTRPYRCCLQILHCFAIVAVHKSEVRCSADSV